MTRLSSLRRVTFWLTPLVEPSSTSSFVPQIYAWIEVDGKPLRISGAIESEKKAIGYIEAQDGKEFIVRFADQRTARPDYHYCARLFIDGIW
jgi:hypothetical protein